MLVGAVASFADDGWGVIRDSDGAEYPFHSTAIADGTRRIESGSPVSFELRPGRQGRWEAAAVTPR